MLMLKTDCAPMVLAVLMRSQALSKKLILVTPWISHSQLLLHLIVVLTRRFCFVKVPFFCLLFTCLHVTQFCFSHHDLVHTIK